MSHFVQHQMLEETAWILQLWLVTLAPREEPVQDVLLNIIGEETPHDHDLSSIAGANRHRGN